MSAAALRIFRIPVALVAVGLILQVTVSSLMANYVPYLIRPGIKCAATVAAPRYFGSQEPAGLCSSVSRIYDIPFWQLMIDATLRSLALLVGAAVLALVIGTLLGTAIALSRRAAIASASLVGVTAVMAAVPAFFVGYFLQIVVIMIGSRTESRFLPVYGFGFDEHVVLPLLAISVPAVTYTAQLTATRLADVLEADFITTARAKGLGTAWILAVHALPHVRPVLLEALGSGLRVSVASLPIVEYLFLWRGLGQLALEAVGVQDAAAFIYCAVVLAGLFALLSALADLSRPRAIYGASHG